MRYAKSISALLSIAAIAASKSAPCATSFNFAPKDALDGDDGLPPHSLQPLRYGKPVYPTTVDGDGLEMVEAHLSYWDGSYYMYSATWGCGGQLFVYADPPDGYYPESPVYPPGDYGADGNCGIKTFRSPDLTNWKLVDFYQPNSNVANVTKPFVRYSNSTQEYILYMGGDGMKGIYYTTSKSPSGPWQDPPMELQGQHLSHDFDIFSGPDGTHYIVSDPFENWIENGPDAVPIWDIWVQQLAPNLTSTVNTRKSTTLVRSAAQLAAQNLTLEATGAFYHDGFYYLMFGMTYQNCAGYIYYYYSENALGPYKDGGFVSKDGCGGQNKGANVLPTTNGSVVVAGNLGYRTGPSNYVYRGGKEGYIWHADNHQAASSTYLFPLQFHDNHTIQAYTCPSDVCIPLAEGIKAPSPPTPRQLDCRVRAWQDIEAAYAQPQIGSRLEFPVWQRTDNLGPTTNSGPVLDGPLNITLTYSTGQSESFSWPASNISWAPAKVAMSTAGKKVSKIVLSTNATNGCYGTLVQQKVGSASTYGARVFGSLRKQDNAELFVYQW